jgi:hypothetical protein
MAYVDFSADTSRLAPGAARFAGFLQAPGPVAEEVGAFTSDEIRVIDLAEQFDAEREFSPRSLLARVGEWAFGLRTDRPLANARLEQLRRFASIAVHHPDRLDDAEFSALLAAGYSYGQAIGLLDHLVRRRRRHI